MLKKPTTMPRVYEVNFLHELDKRSGLYLRLNRIFHEIVDDCGGMQSVSTIRLQMVERYLFLTEVLRKLERRVTRDPDATDEVIGKWIQAINSAQGLAKMIGLDRRAKAVDLRAYLGGDSA